MNWARRLLKSVGPPRHILYHRTLYILVLVLAMMLLVACQYKRIGFQGQLTDSAGNPLEGAFNFKFAYWQSSTSTDPEDLVYEYYVDKVQVVDGLFDVPIGPDSILPADGPDPLIYARPLWVEISVNGETLAPRQPLQGAPYAMSLVGGAVVSSMHEGDGDSGDGDEDITDENYATLSVVAYGTNGTALGIYAPGGDLIRGCTGSAVFERKCPELSIRVTNDGSILTDGYVGSPLRDFAEMIEVDGPTGRYEPGDVLVISASQDRTVELALEPYSSAVVGVYSAKPAFLAGSGANGPVFANSLPVAIVGIVPVKVSAENGSIRRGDLLTTSSTPGHAMHASEYVPGAILGKAMQELESGTGVIDVVLLMQ